MDSTEEWLKYIEDTVIKQRYKIKDYTENKPTKDSDDTNTSI